MEIEYKTMLRYPEIKKVKVIKEKNGLVYYEHLGFDGKVEIKRESKYTPYYKYFDTFREGQSYLLNHYKTLKEVEEKTLERLIDKIKVTEQLKEADI